MLLFLSLRIAIFGQALGTRELNRAKHQRFRPRLNLILCGVQAASAPDWRPACLGRFKVPPKKNKKIIKLDRQY
ncbi:hypothetical protein C8J57DRAFT_1328487 [Mycena rebaudengoi]|nr:hypothetical protein C8J57DRAFT_1328487 [Mycena rebaudengoi]